MKTTQNQIVRIKGEELILDPYKCVYWKAQDTLWISDLHLGKANHFQKSGIPIPDQVSDQNWNRLYHVLDIYHPAQVLFMGDLFHSRINIDWTIFGRFLKVFEQTSYHLIMGNHDILHQSDYLQHGLQLHDELRIEPFVFTHHPLQQIEEGWYNICGHIHPAVKMRGQARQGAKIPCYYFSENQGILPAFGAFTGTAAIRPSKKDDLFLIVENQVIAVS